LKITGKNAKAQAGGSMHKKTALVLSGGGAKGAFQVGAEKYAREVVGYQWDLIAGVSVGALNGAMLASHKFQRLMELWNHLSRDQVLTGGFNLISVIKLLFGSKSFYGNEPLRQLIEKEFDPALVQDDLRIGAVSLVSGEYVQFSRGDPHLREALLASTAIPIIWSPVDVSRHYQSMVDGGVRNLSPLGDVLDEGPDEIIIINCNPQSPPPLENPPQDILQIGLRTLDILLNELFINDLNMFQRINHLVEEAARYGVVLHNPSNGKPYRYFKCKIIEPDEPLGDTLDFSQASIQHSLKQGVRCARQVLGR
jgi:NTE family protein